MHIQCTFMYIQYTPVDSMSDFQDTSKHESIPAEGVGIEVLEAFVQAVSIYGWIL